MNVLFVVVGIVYIERAHIDAFQWVLTLYSSNHPLSFSFVFFPIRSIRGIYRVRLTGLLKLKHSTGTKHLSTLFFVFQPRLRLNHQSSSRLLKCIDEIIHQFFFFIRLCARLKMKYPDVFQFVIVFGIAGIGMKKKRILYSVKINNNNIRF